MEALSQGQIKEYYISSKSTWSDWKVKPGEFSWFLQYYSTRKLNGFTTGGAEGHNGKQREWGWHNLTQAGEGMEGIITSWWWGGGVNLAIERSEEEATKGYMFSCDFGMPPNTPHGGLFSLSPPPLSPAVTLCPLSLSLSPHMPFYHSHQCILVLQLLI